MFQGLGPVILLVYYEGATSRMIGNISHTFKDEILTREPKSVWAPKATSVGFIGFGGFRIIRLSLGVWKEGLCLSLRISLGNPNRSLIRSMSVRLTLSEASMKVRMLGMRSSTHAG